MITMVMLISTLPVMARIIYIITTATAHSPMSRRSSALRVEGGQQVPAGLIMIGMGGWISLLLDIWIGILKKEQSSAAIREARGPTAIRRISKAPPTFSFTRNLTGRSKTLAP